MATDNNRLLLELDNFRREINREIINPDIPELAFDDLKPVLTMVAHARADYIKTLLKMTDEFSGELPSQEAITELRNKQTTFNTLVDAVNALETVIQRDYIDVKPRT